MEKLSVLLVDIVQANPKTNFTFILALSITVTMQHFDIKDLQRDNVDLHGEVAGCAAGNSKVEVLVDRQDKMSLDLARLIDLAFRKVQ